MDTRLVLTLVALLITGVVLALDDRIQTEDIEITNYDVTITTTAAATSAFRGIVDIKFTVKVATKRIELHAVDIDKATITCELVSPAPPPPITIAPDLSTPGRLILTFSETLVISTSYTIKITYDMKFNVDPIPSGLYVYDTPSDSEWITQFGTTEARRVFPCWDQPDKKAIFKITVKYPTGSGTSGYKVFSNELIDVLNSKDGEAKFPATKKISTHVVAWATLKNYQLISITGSTPPLTVIHDPSITRPSLFDVLVKLLPHAVKKLGDYFNYPLSTTKLDVLVLPVTKFSGMENWGVPMFRYDSIAFDEDESSSDDRQRISKLVMHEVAQQWFGDIVTPKWWDEVWLSEGFATYFEYFTLAEVHTDWELKEQFVVQQTQLALRADWYSNKYEDTHVGKHRELHPLIIPNVETTEDVDRVFDFDAITLSKSASMMRMLNQILGEANFKTAVNKYLKNREYGNVDTAYLWNTMHESLPTGALPTGLTLAKVMEKWATEAGYPEIVATRDYDGKTVKLTQSQFLLPPYKADVGTPTWNVPIFWTTEKDPAKSTLHWLLPDVTSTDEINVAPATSEQWMLINKDQAGFYRVNYDQENWQLLSKSFLNLTVSTRAMLLDDALNLARGGRLDYVTALEVTELLSNDTEFAPWSAALNSFSYLYDRLSNEEESRVVIENYILQKMTYIYDSIGGFEITSKTKHVRLLMKQLILHWACRVGHEKCIEDAQDLYNSWPISSVKNPIKADVRRVSYCTAIQQGRKADFDVLQMRYKTSTDPDKPRIVYALGCSNDPDLLRDYLSDSVTITPIPPKTFTITGRQVFTAVCQNPIGVQLAFNFLMTNWYKASIAWDSPPSVVGETEVSKAFSEDLAPKLNTPEQLKQLKELLAFNTLGNIKEGVEIAVGILEDTLVWQENHRDEVIDAMGGIDTPTTTTTKRPSVGAASSLSISVFLLLVSLFIRL